MIDPQRLRDLAETLDGCEWEHPVGSAQLCRDAADEIEQQMARIATLEAALRPFAELASVVRPSDGDDWTFGFSVTAKNLRAAAAAMGGK